jgi:hypothetical protein
MGWKLFAVFFALVTSLGILSPHSYSSPAEIVDTVINIPAAIGLAIMAFGISFLSHKLWRGFALAYMLYSLAYVGSLSCGLYRDYVVNGKALSVVVGAFLLFGALQVAVCVGLWLCARRRDYQQGELSGA